MGSVEVASTAVKPRTKWLAVLLAPGILTELVRLAAWPTAYLLHKLKITSNQVTGARFLAPLVFYWLPGSDPSPWHYAVAVIAFAYSDAVDGVMSRADFEKKEISDIGAVMDPLADKLLLGSMYVYYYRHFPRLVLMTAGGELIICILALIYISMTGKIAEMRASLWGKYKLALEVATALLMTVYAFAPSSLLSRITIAVGITAFGCLLMSLFTKIKKIIV